MIDGQSAIRNSQSCLSLAAFPFKLAGLMKIKTSSSNAKRKPSPRAHSAIVLDGPERAPSRSMLYAVGFKKEDFSKPHHRHRLHLEHGHALQRPH